ncbi:TPA: hypothetical protein ACJIYU_004589, partial [Yersinia enterocolitica]
SHLQISLSGFITVSSHRERHQLAGIHIQVVDLAAECRLYSSYHPDIRSLAARIGTAGRCSRRVETGRTS